MADRIYGIDRGQTEFQVVEGSASPTTGVEVVIDLAVGLTKAEVLMALECIENHIIKGNWPPA
jgi:hypothetical protein